MVLINVYTFLVDQKKIEGKKKLQDKPQWTRLRWTSQLDFVAWGGSRPKSSKKGRYQMTNSSNMLRKLFCTQARDIVQSHLSEYKFGHSRGIIESHASAELISKRDKLILVPADIFIGIVVSKPCLICWFFVLELYMSQCPLHLYGQSKELNTKNKA